MELLLLFQVIRNQLVKSLTSTELDFRSNLKIYVHDCTSMLFSIKSDN